MYPNLDAEIARNKTTRKTLAMLLGITPTTLSMKLNGKSEISLSECVEIKKALGTDKPIEYLFERDTE